jgi:hypothetical protein
MSPANPGFRIGVAANGKRYYSIGIPGTGLYFFKYLRESPSGNAPTLPPTGQQNPGSTVQHPRSPGVPTSASSHANPPQTSQPPWWKQKNLP